MDSQSPTPSPTSFATSPLPSTSPSMRRPQAGGAKRPATAAAAAGKEQKGKKRKVGETEKGIPNKYLVFPEREYEANKSNIITVTPEIRDIVNNT